MQFWQFLGDLHPRLVQFPLVLLLAALCFDAAGLILRRPALNVSGKILWTAGTAFLLFAFICGIYAEIWAGRAGIPQEQIEWHELMANISSWGFVVLMAWRLFLEPNYRKSLATLTIIGFAWYLLLATTAYFGGKLVFEYGAAVSGAHAALIPSLHDLNVLATRQTDLNLHYSQWMHHIFGWLTLALAGSLFAHALFPRYSGKLKWVGPVLLLAGGIFLFFAADLDLYPNFLDPRQLRDREVQLHKTLAIILIFVGAMGIRRFLRKHPDPSSSALAAWRKGTTPSRIVAVMALIGGGMLFTHVHTVAPYANVAAGVYIAHIVLGLTALGIGGARLLQDALPRWKYPLAILFAFLMCIESALLITYNEGLPWYIGYGSYNRWGPHQCTVAPYGPIRAELVFDPATARMDLYILDRQADTPVTVPADQVNVLIARGYTETAVPLTAAPLATGGSLDCSSHFSAVIPFMKDIPAFCARAELPVNGHPKMGYFDPWVTSLIRPVPPNRVALYQCPMHEGALSESPGVCPICGMPLVKIQRTPRTELHEIDYDMRLATDHTPMPGAAVGLTFTPLYQGKLLRDLAIVHEHPLHLIIVSSDYSYFDHVHPVMQPDGTLTLSYAFPKSGTYLLYADITPNGQRVQVFRLPVIVGADRELLADDPPLTPSPAMSHPLPGDPSIVAELSFQPEIPRAGLHTNFSITLTQNGRPISDLEPYIGAMAHCIILSQDGGTFLHCHPEEPLVCTPSTRGGPEIPFHVIFPKPGIYKMWGQFQRGGKMLVADFVVEVKQPLLPPKVINFLLDD